MANTYKNPDDAVWGIDSACEQAHAWVRIRMAGQRSAVIALLAMVACMEATSADLSEDFGSEQAACRVDEPDIAAPEPPVTLVAGQDCAGDLALFDNTVAWVTRGFDVNTTYSGGTVSMVPKTGGPASDNVAVDEGSRLIRYDNYVYWAGRNKIGRVRENGTDKKILVSDSATPLAPRDLAADAGYIYFTTGSSVKAVPRGGGTVIELAGGQTVPTGLAVDDTHVYWTNMGSDNASDGTVSRRPKSGGNIQIIATGQAHPERIAVDGKYLFWTRLGENVGGLAGWTGGTIVRARKDGSSSPATVAPASWPTDLAIDREHIYFTEHRAATIRRVGKSGITSAVTLVSTNEPGFPTAIAVDDTHVYWTLGCGTAADGVRALSKDAVASSNCMSGPELLAEVHEPRGLVATGTWLYYGEHGHPSDQSSNLGAGEIRRVWRNGGPAEIIAAERGQISRVAADSRGVAWAETGADGPGIWAQNNDQTAPLLLAAAGKPADLAMDSSNVFWIDTEGLYRVARTGASAPELLAAAEGLPRHIALAPTYIYWTEDTGGEARVRRVTKTGGTARLLYASTGQAGDLAINATTIYVAVHDGAAQTSSIHAVTRAGGPAKVLATGPYRPRSLHEEDDMLLFTSTSLAGVDLYRLHKTGGLTRLANADGVPAEVAADSLCTAWISMDAIGHGSIRKVSRYAAGIIDPGEEVVFEADLQPVNSLAQGILPVTGKARFTLRGGQLSVRIDAVNMAVGVTHPQHIHRRSACPTMAGDDDNGDGYVDVIEALGTAGGVIVPLDPDLPYLGEQANFPAPDSQGVMAFEAAAGVAELETAINKDLAFETRTVMLHGVQPEFPFPSSVSGIDGVPPHRNIPLACGRLIRISP